MEGGVDFPVGLLTDEDRRAVPVAQPTLQLLRVLCVDLTLADSAGLQPLVRDRLRAAFQTGSKTAPPGVSYLDNTAEAFAGAIAPTVQYSRTEKGFQVIIRLRREATVTTNELTIDGNLDEAANRITTEILAMLKKMSEASGSSH